MAERPNILEQTPEIRIANKEGELEYRRMRRLEIDKVFDFIDIIEEVADKGQVEAFKKMKEILGFQNNQLKDLMASSNANSSTSLSIVLKEREKDFRNFAYMTYLLGVKFAKDSVYKFIAYICNATVEEIKIQPISFVAHFLNALIEHPEVADTFLAIQELQGEKLDKITSLFGLTSQSDSSATSSTQDSQTQMSSASPSKGSDTN